MSSPKILLTQEIVVDIFEHFWNYLLLLLVMLSAFAVIYFTHLNRQTTTELEDLMSQRDELEVEYRNLILEENSLAETSVIESKAEKLLQMQRPDAQSEIYLRLP